MARPSAGAFGVNSRSGCATQARLGEPAALKCPPGWALVLNKEISSERHEGGIEHLEEVARPDILGMVNRPEAERSCACLPQPLNAILKA